MGALTKTLRLYRDSYVGHPKQIWVLAILTLINRMGTMVIPFLTVYLTTVLHFSLRETGLLAGSFGIGSLIGSYFGGKLSDKLGSNFVIVTSLATSGVMLILIQFTVNFNHLFLLILLTAIFGEAYRPALYASVGDLVEPSKTGRSMALMRLAINLGMSASPAIGGFVAIALGYNWLFWIDGLTCILAALYFVISSEKRTQTGTGGGTLIETTENILILPPYKNLLFLTFLSITFMMAFGFVQWFHTIPVFLKSEWGFDERYIGLLMGSNALLISIVEMPIVHSIEVNKKVQASIFVGLAFIGASFLPFLFPKMFILCVVGILFLTIGEILFFPFNGSIALNMSPLQKRGEYMSWYTMSWSLAHILGPAIGMTFIDKFGFSALWIFVVAVVGMGLIINLNIRTKISI